MLRRLFQSNRSALPAIQFCGLVATLFGLFLMGGSSRSDVQSLAILNPFIILCCGVALATLKKEHWRNRKWIGVSLLAAIFLVAIYNIPMPVSFPNISQGSIEAAGIREAASISAGSYAMAISPSAALQSLTFLASPVAVGLFAIQLKKDDLMRTLPLIALIGAISGIVGVLQLAGSSNGLLYLYSITNNGYAVGLFANRNHGAVFLACLFPILALIVAKTYRSDGDGKSIVRAVSIAVAVILIPLILVTGSRSGVLSATVGLVGGVLLYVSHIPRRSDLSSNMSTVPIFTTIVVMCLVFATMYFSRAEAIDRIFNRIPTADVRPEFWTASLDLFWKYFPVGFGPGSFVAAFQYDEPFTLLGRTYLNTLHNDWLETGLTFGVLGVVLMITGLIYFIARTFKLWARLDGRRSAVALSRMASVIIVILAMASITDYPLRTPALMAFAALVVVWFCTAGDEDLKIML